MTKNTTVVNLTDGRQVLLSYGVPVAAFVPGRGYVKTDRKYSVTTSKHATQFAGQSATVLPDADFLKLVTPVVAR